MLIIITTCLLLTSCKEKQQGLYLNYTILVDYDNKTQDTLTMYLPQNTKFQIFPDNGVIGLYYNSEHLEGNSLHDCDHFVPVTYKVDNFKVLSITNSNTVIKK